MAYYLDLFSPETYEAFSPAEAKRLADKLEIHHTPKHGSWLNVAEIELSVLGRQCLDQRIAALGLLRGEVAAWEARRSAARTPVDWRFTAAAVPSLTHVGSTLELV